ncbi:hypothetical protein F0562_008886 [Nyssa sinensis]|uniref:EF-hand domain-containing protein n=1 Tax=Nyssa sinensis TaxID=561372 RepID=A0A5J5A709_9ASTE|nr:hypothetical protein F0562_008886 [Nyssa sinensis]
MIQRLGADAFMVELCNGFRLLMDVEKGLITFESLKRNTFLLGLQEMEDEELVCMLREGDLDGDGALNQMEFCILMFRLSPGLMDGSKRWMDEMGGNEIFSWLIERVLGIEFAVMECELCGYPARMFCEVDRASLCWDCDEKVHCTNFLVAKHSWSLLCHVYQSPTSWKASGPKLAHLVSICEACDNCEGIGDERGPEGDVESQAGNEDEKNDDLEVNDDSEDDDAEYVDGDDDDEEYDDDDDGENQIVPWAFTPAPHADSCSSS